MKYTNISSKFLVGIVVAFFMLITGPLTVFAAITPSLGTAGTFGILSNSFGYNIGLTSITGDLGYNGVAPGGGATLFVSGSTQDTTAAWTAAGLAQNAALDTGLNNLNGQACTHNFPNGAINLATDTTHGQIGVYTPGVYCVTGAATIGTAGITLKGSGTYIFRITGALDSVVNSHVYSAGASSCDVFWTPGAATTLAANSSFFGTNIDPSGITIGSTVTWLGRALAYGGTVTADTDTITSTCTVGIDTAPRASGSGFSLDATLSVVKTVINDNGGIKTVANFPLFVSGTPVVSGAVNSFPAPISYVVTETSDSNYTQSFSGDCDANGRVTLNFSDHKVCVITNNDIGASSTPPVPPLIDVVKTASPLSLPSGPGLVTYTYTLRNIGTVPVTNITMVGDTCSPIVLASGDINANAKLEVNETWVHTCSTTLPATHTNTVVATGCANGISATDIASATVVVGLPVVPPLIHVVKVPSVFTLPAGGGAVTYTYTVTNPGTSPLNNVSITDDKCTGLPGRVVGHPGDLNKNDLLERNESWSFTCKSNLTKTTMNIATAEGSANGLTARDLALATVVVASPKLPNTGLPSREKSFPWNVLFTVGILVLVTTAAAILSKRAI